MVRFLAVVCALFAMLCGALAAPHLPMVSALPKRHYNATEPGSPYAVLNITATVETKRSLRGFPISLRVPGRV